MGGWVGGRLGFDYSQLRLEYMCKYNVLSLLSVLFVESGIKLQTVEMFVCCAVKTSFRTDNIIFYLFSG